MRIRRSSTAVWLLLVLAASAMPSEAGLVDCLAECGAGRVAEGHAGPAVTFRMQPHTAMLHVMDRFCRERGLDPMATRCVLDTRRILAHQAPAELGVDCDVMTPWV